MMEAVEQLAATAQGVADTISSIGTDMSIVGKVLCTGSLQVFGSIEGELSGAGLVIGDGADVQGSVSAQEVTVLGRVRGTIRAVKVKLLGRAAVEGDIFHQKLSIEEEALFEGSSRPLACT
jgi:cytoskeletal protein CcmA (bactofilin family)